MRARNLKPGFFKNDELAECDPLARILFQGLWCMADRTGRLELRPKRLKAEILPYDNADILKLLNQLIAKGFVVAYRYGNEFFLSIPTFTQHQNPHIKEAESTIPAPDESDTCTVLILLNPESLLLNPESPLPIKRAPVKTGASDSFILPEDIDPVIWNAFIEMRNKMKAPLTDKAKELIIAKLDKLILPGQSKDDILKQSIEHSWKGVFELKTGGNNGNGTYGRGSAGKVTQSTQGAGNIRDSEAYPVDCEETIT